MVDFPHPIDPFEHVKVDKIREIGQEEEKAKKEILRQKPVKKKLFLYLTFLKIISNALKIIRNPSKSKPLEQTPIHQELHTIQSSLNALKEKNLCQDTEFLNFFAFIWMKFLKDCNNYTLSNKEALSLIQQLINEINQYPKDTEFTLGYYISEFAGYKWIPFPYMEILRNLHFEYIKNPQTSHLKIWSDILEKLLTKV